MVNPNPRLGRKSFDDDKAFKIAAGVWVACVLVGLAFWGLIGFVAYHFITKFW